MAQVQPNSQEEVDSDPGVAGYDRPNASESAAVRGRVGGGRRHERFRFQVPHLQRTVVGGGHHPPRVRTHLHGVDQVRVTG